MAFLLPFLGRRTVIKKLTFGIFGRQESQRWWLTGPVAVGLHLASNAVNAVIIQRTPGFSKTSITDLTFLWCTRPRIAWLIVALLPYQAVKAMYFSAAASTLFGEVILQLFGSYYMGTGANYARRQKFFFKGHLASSGYGTSAAIMYAGSLLWLVVVTFAIIACAFSIFGVSDRIQSLRTYWIETRRAIKENYGTTEEIMSTLQNSKARVKLSPPSITNIEQRELHDFQAEMGKAGDEIINDLGELIALWQQLPDHLRIDENERKQKMKRKNKIEEKLEQHQGQDEKRQMLSEEHQKATQEFDVCNRNWLDGAHDRQIEALHRRTQTQGASTRYLGQKNVVEDSITGAERRMLPFKNTIAVAQQRSVQLDSQTTDLNTRLKLEKKHSASSSDPAQTQQIESELADLTQQKETCLSNIRTAEVDPKLLSDRALVSELKQLLAYWHTTIDARSKLEMQWSTYAQYLQNVSERRRKAAEASSRVGHFPIVVVSGMTLCWIAQWLWWAGYIGVAGDDYCPPRLLVIASIWTAFSSLGMTFGTSF